jgi:uncharacterized protein YbjT (DUF2867 family)
MEETQEVLVTGGTGTLGRRVVGRLRERGRKARVMSRSGRPGTIKADLLTGKGIEAAVRGMGIVIHCASNTTTHNAPNPRKSHQADVGGTQRLLRAAATAGVAHVVFISIVGVERNPFFYYRAKLDAERVVERSPVPWTILRSTQFHDFMLGMIRPLSRFPLVVPAPKGFLLQPIEVGEVAERLVELALAAPSGRAPDVAGPEVRTLADLTRAYLEATGRRKRVVEVPLPGRTARAVREGAQVAPAAAWGTVTWEEFLRRTASASPAKAKEARA